MDEFIVPAKKKHPKKINPSEELYTIIGKEDYIDKNNNPRLKQTNDTVLAKKLYRDNGSYKLMIMCNAQNKPMDPNNELGETNSTVGLSYRHKKRFVTVNQKAFEHYLSFLRTGVKAWLLNAERELL